MKYLSRKIESKIKTLIKQFPAIALTGPRQTGKSTTLKYLFPKYNYITFDSLELRSSAKQDPNAFVDAIKKPVIIDEIQYVPEILPYIKISIDNNRKNGQFILTGSQMFPLISGISETLAGRIALLEMLPFSFLELQKIPTNITKCYEQILKGFYPIVNTQKTDLNAFYGSYLATYIEKDVRQVQNIKDINQFQKFVQLLAARAGNLLNLQEISKEAAISRVTAQNWLSILQTSRIIYLLQPYYQNITKRVIKTPKIYFTDTGLLCNILRYQTTDILMASLISGAVFENMFIMEILKQNFNNNTNNYLYFYRDSNQNEVDLVIDKGNEIDLIEIKSGKNINPSIAKKMENVPIQAKKYFVVSFLENKIPLSKKTLALPWWQFFKNIEL